MIIPSSRSRMPASIAQPYFSLFLSLVLYSTAAIAQILVPDAPRCYFPDGSLRNSTDYQPCNNVRGQHSMCCAIGANRGADVDICLSNGLCSGVTAEGDGTRALWRESCTDPTWKSPACLNICMRKGNGYNWLIDDAPITLCQDGTVCCGGKVTGGNCCTQGKGVQLPVNPLQSTATVVTTLISTASSKSGDRSASISTATLITTVISTDKNGPSPTGSKSRTASSDGEGTDESPTSARQTSRPTNAPIDSEDQTPSGALDNTPETSQPVDPPAFPNSNSSGGLPTSAKIAIGVAAPVLLLSIIAGAFFLRRHYIKNRPPPVYEKNMGGPYEMDTNGAIYRNTTKGRRYYELQKPARPEHHVNVHELQ